MLAPWHVFAQVHVATFPTAGRLVLTFQFLDNPHENASGFFKFLLVCNAPITSRMNEQRLNVLVTFPPVWSRKSSQSEPFIVARDSLERFSQVNLRTKSSKE